MRTLGVGGPPLRDEVLADLDANGVRVRHLLARVVGREVERTSVVGLFAKLLERREELRDVRRDLPGAHEVNVEEIVRATMGARLEPEGEEHGLHHVIRGVVGATHGVIEEPRLQAQVARPQARARFLDFE